MEQITQETAFPPSLTGSPSTRRKQPSSGQPLNLVRVASKPLLTKTLPGIVISLSISLTFSFVVLILSTLAGLQLGNIQLHPNPFVTFESVWPGQSIASLAIFAQQTHQGKLLCLTGASPSRNYAVLDVRVVFSPYDAFDPTIRCTDYPTDGMFRVVGLKIVDDRIQQLVFYSDVLPEDVLLLYWGMPDSITQSRNPQLRVLHWNRDTYSAASVVKPDSIVKLVILTVKE